MKNKLCIYHANCADGFGAALAVYLSPEWGKETEFLPAHYGSEPPDVTGKNVIIVDFSYPRAVLQEMAAKASKLLVIDHHETSKEALAGLDYCHFDMSHSGAYLTWTHLHNDDHAPPLICYIEDRDLWKWQLAGSKEFSAALASYPISFGVWINIHMRTSDDRGRENFINEGKSILRYQQQQIDKAIDTWKKQPAFVELRDENGTTHTVPIINSTTLISEIGSGLADGHPFACTYFDSLAEGKRIFSLRRRNGDINVATIARHYGGGGHPAAAGFSLDNNSESLPKIVRL